MTELARLRGRIAYWEKRIELEKTERRKQQLEVFALAELARLIVREGMRVYGIAHNATFAEIVQQQFRIVRQLDHVNAATSQVFEGSPPPTGSRRKKLKRPRARVAKDRA